MKSAKLKKQKLKNKKNIVLGFLLVSTFIVLASLITFMVVSRDKGIDFSQEITNADGTDFNSIYNAKTDDTFTFRIANLECNDNCSNVSLVKIGDQILTLDDDYKIEHGSIIITIFKKALQKIQNGQHDIVVDVEKDGKIISVGITITITNNNHIEENPEQNKNENSDNNKNEEPANTSENKNNSSSQNQSKPTNNQNSSTSKTESKPESQTNTESKPEQKPEPTPEPQPEPTPEPQPVHTAEFNLNDGYQVSYLGVHMYRIDENGNAILNEDGTAVDSFSYNKCEIQKKSVTIKTTYSTSNARNIPYNQWQAEIQAAQARGLGGQGGGWVIDLNEQYCGLCGLSCDRW